MFSNQIKISKLLCVLLTYNETFINTSLLDPNHPQLCWTRLWRLNGHWIKGPTHSGVECAVERCDVHLSEATTEQRCWRWWW